MYQVMLRNGNIEWVTSETFRNLQAEDEVLFIVEEKYGSLDGYFDSLRLSIPD